MKQHALKDIFVAANKNVATSFHTNALSDPCTFCTLTGQQASLMRILGRWSFGNRGPIVSNSVARIWK